MLSTGLMVGSAGGAIAAADTDSGAPPSSVSPANDAGPPSKTSHRPIATIADTVRKVVETSLYSTVQGVTGTLNSLTLGQPQSPNPKSPKTTFGGTPTVYGSLTPSPPPLDVTPPAAEAPPVAEPKVVVPPPTPPPVAPRPDALAPVSNAVVTVANTIIAVPGVIAGLPTSVTSVADVLSSIQNVLTSVGDAGTSFSQLPTDLAGLLGVSATVPTATVGTATGLPWLTAVATTPTTAPRWSAGSQLPALLGVESVGAADTPPALVTPLDVSTTGAISGESTSGSILPTSKDDGANDVLSIVQHAIGAFVATVSLSALVAVALPGLLGLLTTCIAGIRVGYRQAKAGSSLPNTAVSRFVGAGPIGVVRSSSQVELRSRAMRVIRPARRDTGRTRALRVVGSSSQLLDEAV